MRLLSPPPLDEAMRIQREGATLRVTHAETIVAEARAIDGGLCVFRLMPGRFE